MATFLSCAVLFNSRRSPQAGGLAAILQIEDLEDWLVLGGAEICNPRKWEHI